ncbi:MAG: trypsin-like peptidase domain-containing protein [Planctomycetota bacterium]
MTLLTAASLLCAALLATPARADELSSKVLERAKAATVLIKARSPVQASQGSGFFISRDVVVTNAHVLGLLRPEDPGPSLVVVVLRSGVAQEERSVRARVIGVDPPNDLAFLEVPGVRAPAVLEVDPELRLRETQPVYAFGFPFGTALAERGNPAVTVTAGSISSVRLDEGGTMREVQINGNLNPGNSGGPVLDAQGKVVGVAVATIQGTTISFAIPFGLLHRDLLGRPASLSFHRIRRIEGRYEVDLSIEMLDPLRRLRGVSVRTWSQGAALRAPAAGSSRRAAKLEWNPQLGRFSGQMVQPVPAGETMWMELVVVDAAGVSRSFPPDPLPELPELARRLEEQAARGAPGPGAPSATPSAPSAPASEAEVVRPRGVVAPRVPAGLQPLSSRRALDREGRDYDLVEGSVQQLTLPKGLLDLVAAPDGSELFVVHAGVCEVAIYDPLTLQRRGAIPAPRVPVALYCGVEHLVVACDESAAVVIFDRRTHQPVQSARLRDDRQLVPYAVVGRAPDGSYLTLWRQRAGRLPAAVIVAVDLRGETRELYQASSNLRSVTVLGPGRLLLQDQSSSLLEARARPRHPLLGQGGFGDLSAAFRTHDHAHVALPVSGREETRTHLFTPDLQTDYADAPGSPVAEVPHERLLVTWGASRITTSPDRFVSAYYVSRYTGRVLRRIRTKDLPVAQQFERARTCFVPGVERLLFFYPSAQGPGQVQAIQCGPLREPLRAPPGAPVPAPLPARAAPGAEVTFTPRLEGVPAGTPVKFRLRGGPPGARVNAYTGALTWRPTALSLGRWDLEIDAEVGGEELKVAKWVLEVE